MPNDQDRNGIYLMTLDKDTKQKNEFHISYQDDGIKCYNLLEEIKQKQCKPEYKDIIQEVCGSVDCGTGKITIFPRKKIDEKFFLDLVKTKASDDALNAAYSELQKSIQEFFLNGNFFKGFYHLLSMLRMLGNYNSEIEAIKKSLHCPENYTPKVLVSEEGVQASVLAECVAQSKFSYNECKKLLRNTCNESQGTIPEIELTCGKINCYTDEIIYYAPQEL